MKPSLVGFGIRRLGSQGHGDLIKLDFRVEVFE